MRNIFVLILILFNTMGSMAQGFKNKSFDFMVKQLLSHTVDEVKAEDVAEDTGKVFLDARARYEYQVSHIEGAVWVGYDEFEMEKLEGVDKDREVVVYCSVGYRSEKIGEKLEEAGFNKVTNMTGGIFDWTNKGYPVVDSLNNPTKKVHAFNKTWGIWLNDAEKVYDK